MEKVFLTEHIHPDAVAYLRENFEVVQGTSTESGEIIRQAQGCSAILIRSAKITAEIMDAIPTLKVVAKHGMGVDNIAVDHATEKGILVDNAPFSNMVLGEVLNRPGKWSSYPPHHHPQPEVYFYRFDYPHGFGAGFANGDVYKTEQNGCAVINHGFHSQVVAPGYAMCYAWGIRHLEGDPWLKTRIDDKEHEWLWKPDANDHIYPNH